MIELLAANAAGVYLPEFINPHPLAQSDLQYWQENFPGVAVLDLFEAQKKELFKIKHPQKPLTGKELDSLYEDWKQSHDPDTAGAWIYYPWLNKILHILGEEEFISLRTNRNFYKISPQEQKALSKKSIGIIGLSVGHAVALTLATERVCGKMKLADFDTLELSNLNRIKTGLHNLGLNKAIIAAREIAEIDPYIDVTCYTDGITEDNIDSFLMEGGKLDILVDECDSIDMKILCRQKAKSYRIPVVMETSDRGMLDVERYDLEEDRPLIHGLLDGVPLDQLKNLSTEQKVPLVLKIADVNKGSLRGKVSMLEVGQSIATWPQLASSITLGGAVVTDVCRRISLDQYHDSGRYYIDLEELAGNKQTAKPATQLASNPFEPFDAFRAIATISTNEKPAFVPDVAAIKQIVKAACHAPSTGNDQPWKWMYRQGVLYLFHDHFRSFSFGDFQHIASYISFGAACENIVLQSHAMGWSVSIQRHFEQEKNGLVASIIFHQNHHTKDAEPAPFPELINQVFSRSTNRNPSEPVTIPAAEYALMSQAAESVEGAKLLWFTDKSQLLEIGKIIGECDRIRLLNPQGHHDFAHREMRWSAELAEKTRDGIDIRTLGLSKPLQAALSIIRDPTIVAGLKQIDGGKALVSAALATVMKSSAIGMIILPNYSIEGFFNGGISMQRTWLRAEELGYAVHPLISPFYLFPRITKADGEGLDKIEIDKLKSLRERFLNIVPLSGMESEVFLFKIAKADKPAISTLRLPIEECFWELND